MRHHFRRPQAMFNKGSLFIVNVIEQLKMAAELNNAQQQRHNGELNLAITRGDRNLNSVHFKCHVPSKSKLTRYNDIICCLFVFCS
jgi:hypothetical protein